MANRSHLTPVRVTDRHGWARTVYRRLLGRPSPGKPVPPPTAPTESIAADAPSPEQLAALASLAEAFGPSPSGEAAEAAGQLHELLKTADGQLAGLLALELVSVGALDELLAAHILATSHYREYPHEPTLDALRAAVRLRDRLPAPTSHDGAQQQALRLLAASNGMALRAALGSTRDKPDLAAQGEGTERALAVIEFLVRVTEGVELDGSPKQVMRMLPLSKRGSTGGGKGIERQTGFWLTDQQLEAFIHDRRDEMDQMVACALGCDRRITAPLLEALLDLDTPAIADGWL